MNFLTHFNYMKAAKYWIGVSIILTIAGLVAFATVGLNKGIDFTGGVMLDVRFDSQVTSKQIEEVVVNSLGAGAAAPSIQQAEVKGDTAGNKSEWFIRTGELSQEQRDKLYKDLEQVGKYEKVSEDLVSGTVSGELTQKAILAVAIAGVVQTVYLWIRFRSPKFGITAMLALLHDIVITLGLVAIFKIQINSPFVAAILTILGYSINDTVIVFDRIREHLANRKKGESLADLVTKSIQETIVRSIYTVLTVLICLAALLIWGGDTIRDFSATLFIGITSGMYSSIFIAAALWLYWQNHEESKRKMAPGKAKPAKA